MAVPQLPACLRRDGISQELRLLVPAALCGSIIGKGGATIRSFSEDSKAQIGLSPQVLVLRDVHVLDCLGILCLLQAVSWPSHIIDAVLRIQAHEWAACDAYSEPTYADYKIYTFRCRARWRRA